LPGGWSPRGHRFPNCGPAATPSPASVASRLWMAGRSPGSPEEGLLRQSDPLAPPAALWVRDRRRGPNLRPSAPSSTNAEQARPGQGLPAGSPRRRPPPGEWGGSRGI